MSALCGVRFRAMSALGPSGARPEHLRELVAVRDRRVAAQLLGAIGRLHEVAAKGELCAAARWLLDSRLVFLRKKSGNAPRPIRVGEMWRRVIAKRLVDANREKAQRFCLAARQFGVAVPSGAEGLVHFRAQAERLLGAADTATAVDVDLKNAFPTLEWDESGRLWKHSSRTWRRGRAAVMPCPRASYSPLERRDHKPGRAAGRPLGPDILRARGRRGWFLAARETCAVGWRTESIQHSTATDPARQEHVLGVDFGAFSG